MTADNEQNKPAVPPAPTPVADSTIPGLNLLLGAIRPPKPSAPPEPVAVNVPSSNPKPAPPKSFIVQTTFHHHGTLGEGGLGVVWSVRDSALGREVALKQIRSEATTSPSARNRFIREAQITGLLEHPSIIPVHLLSADGSPFYTMQLVRGGTLRDAIEAMRQQRLLGVDVRAELRRLLAIFLRVCDAIAYAHSKGIVHRDLKPANVVLGSFGEVFVLDWGLAKILDSPVDSLNQVESDPPRSDDETRDGQILGTAAFMAPEQALGKTREIEYRTDVFGLGAMLYAILTGNAPFAASPADSMADRLRRAASCKFRKPSEVQPEISKPLEAICLRAMAAEPGERYQTARLLADDLRRWLDDDPISVYRDPWYMKLSRWASHHPSQATGLAVTLLALVIIGAVLATYIVGGSRIAINRQKLVLREHVRQTAGLTEMVLQWGPTALENLRSTLPLAVVDPQGELDLEKLRVFLKALMTTDGNYSSVIFVEPRTNGKELVRLNREGFAAPPHPSEPKPRISEHLAPLVAKSLASPNKSHYGDWRPITFGKEKTIEFPLATTIYTGDKLAGVVVILLTLSEDTLANFVAATSDDNVDGYLVDQSGTILAWISRQGRDLAVGQPFSEITLDLPRQLAAKPNSEEIFEDDWEDYQGILFAKRIRYDHNDPSRWLLVAIGKTEAEIVADVWRLLSLASIITLVLIVASIAIGLFLFRRSIRPSASKIDGTA